MQKYVLGYLSDPSLEKVRKDIIRKAEGVFLWIFFVTDSLLRGYRSHDSEETLLRRLESYPAGLDELYTHMLNGIDPFHKRHAAAYFLMAHLSRRKIKPMPELTVMTLTVTMDKYLGDYSSSWSSSLVTAEKFVSQCRITEELVQVYCRGLLEITTSRYDFDSDSDSDSVSSFDSDSNFSFDSDSNSKDANIDKAPTQVEMKKYDRKRIDFTHRTAYDFILDSIVGTKFVKGPLYSEDELEIRLVSGLLNQLMLRPESASRIKSALERPIAAASSVQKEHSIRDSLLDIFYDTICSSDEKSFGGILTRRLKEKAAGNSSNGFLMCCMKYSDCKPSFIICFKASAL